jgi:histidinol-phosphate aminotransferase
MIKVKKHLETITRALPKEASRMFKHRLDRNERNEPFSDEFMERVKKKITGELFMVYPEMDPAYERISSWLKIDPACLMLQSGSEQAIKSIFEAFISPGDAVLLHFPGFAMYEVYCNMFQAKIIKQNYDSNLNFDWDRYEDSVTPAVRMVVVENPNGFLGTAPYLDKLRKIVEKSHKLGVIVLVDEAYFHFHDQTAIDWIGQYDNLIICRTFSKAFGLAGLRAGYLISQAPNITSLKKVRPAYEMTAATALLVCELIDNIKEVTSYTDATKRNLTELRKGFRKLGIDTSDSKANFVAARLGDAAIHDELRKVMATKNILIRQPFREDRLKEWVRISTASPKIQNILFEELSAILRKVKK